MSWEEMSSQTRPCHCGKGTIEYTIEMDDWNRSRHFTKINCASCRKEAARREAERVRNERARERLLLKASRLAKDRYSELWQARFQNLSKREVWQSLTGGTEYPALGTFYKHIKDEGLEKYLGRIFLQDISKALKQLGVKDKEVQKLLSQSERT